MRRSRWTHLKIHARVHILSQYMPLVSDSKHSLILVQIDQTFVRGDREQTIPSHSFLAMLSETGFFFFALSQGQDTSHTITLGPHLL